MMKILADLLYITTGIFSLFVMLVVIQSDDFRIARTGTVNATPAEVFANINDLQHWNNWQPWVRLDPNAKIKVIGSGPGIGEQMSWDSESNSFGEGTMAITDSRPEEYVRFKIDLTRPIITTYFGEIHLKAAGSQTIVTWSMSGKNGFVGKAVNLIFGYDRVIGSQFEHGLTNLDSLLKQKN